MKTAYDLICVGTALVDSLIRGFDPEPISASGYRAESGALSVGGEAVNQAMAAAKLGLRTAILCSLGRDQAGDLVAGALERCGVDTGLLLRSEAHATPVTTMFVRGDGSRRSITNSAHRYNFHPERCLERLSGARMLCLGSLFRAPFDDPEIIGAVLRFAAERSIPVLADTKLPNFRKLSLDDVREALPLIHTITPNEDEARYYTGREEPQAMAEAFLERGVQNVVIKLGAKGCYFQNPSLALRLPPCPVEAVDATGAGDNFVAGYAAELLRGADLPRALRFANACGAICSTAVGAGTALRDRAQVEAFLRETDSAPPQA